MKKQIKIGENTTVTYGWERNASKKTKAKKKKKKLPLMARIKAYLKRNIQFIYIKEYEDDEVK